MTSRPIRIGLFLVTFPRLSETFIVTKVLKLLDNGFDVHIFTMSEHADWSRFAILDGRDDVRARVHLVPPLKPLRRVVTTGAMEIAKTALREPRAFAKLVAHTWKHRDENSLSVAKTLYEHIRFVGQELDILHIEFDYQGLGIADLKEYLGCRVLCSSRATFQNSSVYAHNPQAPDYLFRYADGYHFISDFVDDNTRRLGLPSGIPTWHIEPAIDLSLFQPRPRPQRAAGPLKIISVGRLAWAKGYEFALDAVARVRAAGIEVDYQIYGEGPFEEAIRFSIRQLGLENCARIAGIVRREDAPQVYADADVMLHAALEEGFCNAVIEAQAMELPVVTSDAGGLPENVEDGVTGYVVPRRDPEALADKLLVLAGDPDLRRRLGQAGRRRALERFDLDRQAEAFVKLYTELAALPRREISPR